MNPNEFGRNSSTIFLKNKWKLVDLTVSIYSNTKHCTSKAPTWFDCGLAAPLWVGPSPFSPISTVRPCCTGIGLKPTTLFWISTTLPCYDESLEETFCELQWVFLHAIDLRFKPWDIFSFFLSYKTKALPLFVLFLRFVNITLSSTKFNSHFVMLQCIIYYDYWTLSKYFTCCIILYKK